MGWQSVTRESGAGLMGVLYWFLALFCSPVPSAHMVAIPCDVTAQQVCCSWAYIVDRYCCPDANDPLCEDDCTEKERKQDYINALWGSERQCIDRDKLATASCDRSNWTFDGGEMAYYDTAPTIWSVLVWWFFPSAEPFDDHLECLRFNPQPQECNLD